MQVFKLACLPDEHRLIAIPATDGLTDGGIAVIRDAVREQLDIPAEISLTQITDRARTAIDDRGADG